VPTTSARRYAEEIRPLLDARFPELPHAAAELDGSGPLMIFLREEDGGRAGTVRGALDRLPADRPPRVTTVRRYAEERLGVDARGPLTPAHWLSFPTRTLAELTGGPVHADGTGELTDLRRRLDWYPGDVWRYVLAASWTRLGRGEVLMPLAGQAGDELGSAVLGARLAGDAMALAFLLERRWAPGPGSGPAFAGLEAAPALTPLLADLLAARTWPERQDAYAGVAERLLARQAALGLTDPMPARAEVSGGPRPFWVIRGGRVAAALLHRVTDPEVRRLATRPVVGAVDQWGDDDGLTQPGWRAAVRGLYG
jgi:hypothetical protein